MDYIFMRTPRPFSFIFHHHHTDTGLYLGILGRVWFTVEARVHDPSRPSQQYTAWSVARPILLCSIFPLAVAGAFLTAGLGVVGAGMIAAGETLPAWLAAAVLAGDTVFVAGSIIGVGVGAEAALNALLTGEVVTSRGWYMSGERTVFIRGGPEAVVVDGKIYVNFEKNVAYPPFKVEELDPNAETDLGDIFEG